MPDGDEGVVEDHAGAGEAHDGADAVTHFRFVAVDGAFLACGFCRAEFAAAEAFVGVGKQFAAFRAKGVWSRGLMPVLTAVESDHQLDGLFLPVSPAHVSLQVRSR